MNLPRYIRTKAEALALAASIMPDFKTALATVTADPRKSDYPYYWIESDTRDTLRQVFDWLFADETRIYKRARWHLFYDLAHRLTKLLAENRDAQDRYWTRQFHERDRKSTRLNSSHDRVSRMPSSA